MRRYTHSANVDEPLQVETFTAAGAFDAAYTYHADHLGSIRYLTDSSGSIVNAYDYDSYGRPMFGVTQFDQPFAYTGREWDAATGLYHYRARAYDAETGRFLQEDPIGFAAGGLNVYRYVGSNPANYSDPSGLLIGQGQASASSATTAIAIGTGVGTFIGCVYGGIADAISLAGQPDISQVNLVGCGAQAVAAGALSAVPVARIGSAFRGVIARNASAKAFQMAKSKGAKLGMVAALVTKDGKIFLGASTKVGLPQSKILKELAGFCSTRRRCAEIDAINNALRAGVDVRGALISIRAISNKSAKNALEGLPFPPCQTTCAGALGRLGIKVAD